MSFKAAARVIRCIICAVCMVCRCFLKIIDGRGKWTVMQLVFTTIMGGCMGSMGSAIAHVSEYQPWADVLSGILGASGAFGLDLVIKRLTGTERINRP